MVALSPRLRTFCPDELTSLLLSSKVDNVYFLFHFQMLLVLFHSTKKVRDRNDISEKNVTVPMLTSGINLVGHEFQAPNKLWIFFHLYLFVLSTIHLSKFYKHFHVFLS